MAGIGNGAYFVPETKLARWTCGTPDWSSQAAEELQPKTSTAPRHERSVR